MTEEGRREEGKGRRTRTLKNCQNRQSVLSVSESCGRSKRDPIVIVIVMKYIYVIDMSILFKRAIGIDNRLDRFKTFKRFKTLLKTSRRSRQSRISRSRR